MLGRGYVTIGNVTLPNPVDFSISYENNETQGVSEAGTLLVSVTRLLRRNISMTCQVTSFWRDKILDLCGENSTTLVLEGETINGRLRLNTSNLERHSEYTPNTEGLWTLNVTFIEN